MTEDPTPTPPPPTRPEPSATAVLSPMAADDAPGVPAASVGVPPASPSAPTVSTAVGSPTVDADSDSVAAGEPAPGRFARAWKAFTRFRRTRPFWGGLWLAFGGWTILSFTIAPLTVTFAAGVGGVSGYVLGGSMVLFAFFAWFVPSQRHLAGLLGVIFAIASLVLSNLGGFLVGLFCGVVGGAMIFSWGPPPEHKLLRRIFGRPSTAGD